ncbi:MAG: hypothetical protein ACLUUO_13510 [Sellimonas intestinalis]
MKENSVAPETPFHESEPGERGSREDTSYSYGEYRREGAPYQAQDHGSQGEWDSTPLTMGDWLLTLLAAFIPCCGGIILYCYWAFAKQGNLHRRNFCRAALIIEAVTGCTSDCVPDSCCHDRKRFLRNDIRRILLRILK